MKMWQEKIKLKSFNKPKVFNIEISNDFDMKINKEELLNIKVLICF